MIWIFWFLLIVVFIIGLGAICNMGSISERIAEHITNYVKMKQWNRYKGESLTKNDIPQGQLKEFMKKSEKASKETNEVVVRRFKSFSDNIMSKSPCRGKRNGREREEQNGKNNG